MNWTQLTAPRDNSVEPELMAFVGAHILNRFQLILTREIRSRSELPLGISGKCAHQARKILTRTLTVVLLMAGGAAYSAIQADDTGSRQITSDTLRDDQLAVSGRYERFERLLSQMADVLAHEDPERAELLRRAVSKGREKSITRQLNTIAEDLDGGNLGSAMEKQESAIAALNALLKMLQSEDRRSELEKERERISNILKDVRNTLIQQRSARARTQNAAAPSSSAPDQQKAIDQADEVLKDIRDHDGNAADSKSSDGDTSGDSADGEESSSDNESGDVEPSDEDSSDGQSDAGEKSDAESSEGEKADTSSEGESGKPSESGEPADGERSPGEPTDEEGGKPADQPPSDSESDSPASGESQSPSESPSDSQSQSQSQSSPSDDQPSSQSPPEEQTPGAEQIQNARQMMQEALEQLQQQLRDKAMEEQDGAIDELRKAVTELQKRLLQLREEEKEMILASLEARFQRMLAIETQIHDETLALATTPQSEWLDTMYARSREVAQQQTELQLDCEQTLGLLREDGTSVAIVLSVEDIAIDMMTIAGRLRGSQVGSLTQTLQTDIIEALRELIEATQREMDEMKSEERQQQQQQGDMKPPDLVDMIAEIRVLRSLQLRINRRTQRIDALLTEQPTAGSIELAEQLEELARRQQRLVESAAELRDRMENQR